MIKFEFPNLTQAMQDIVKYSMSIKDRMNNLLEVLMNEGWDIAATGFSEATYDGDRDVMLNLPYWEGNTLYLEANGNSVAFIEFGSGTAYEDYPPDALPTGVLPHGEYGKKRGATPPWVYVGHEGDTGEVLGHKKDGRAIIRTMGNPPARAMYNASKVLDKDHILQVAKEVFNK